MKATCELCEKEAMYAPDYDEAEEAFLAADAELPVRKVVLKCAYCGNEQRTSDLEAIHHAYLYDDVIKSHWARVLESERQKVARLQEGRW